MTIYQTLGVQLALIALGDVESHVERRELRAAKMNQLLLRDNRLNHRQRSVLSVALQSPEAGFKIHPHKRKYNIAYSTARRDLLDLSEAGYLKMQQEGKAFVFVPPRDLHRIIEGLSSADAAVERGL